LGEDVDVATESDWTCTEKELLLDGKKIAEEALLEGRRTGRRYRKGSKIRRAYGKNRRTDKALL
jgi:hypothetical protein